MKSNSLIFKDTKTKEVNASYAKRKRTTVTIRLNDHCKNGHQDFAITCETKQQANNNRWIDSSWGADHERIIKLWPEFKPFIDLHGSDFEGSPTHAKGNGYYYLVNSPEVLKKGSYNFTEEELKYFLNNCEDAQHFNYLLESKGIVNRWKAAATAAIKQLEELTGNTFVNDSTRSQYTPLTAQERKELEEKISAGYYTPEKVQQRKDIKAKEARAKQRAEAKADHDKKVIKAGNALQVKLFMIDNSPVDNYIYYDHSKQIKFNWLSYGDQISQEEFIDFINEVDKSKLPEGIEFAIEDK